MRHMRMLNSLSGGGSRIWEKIRIIFQDSNLRRGGRELFHMAVGLQVAHERYFQMCAKHA